MNNLTKNYTLNSCNSEHHGGGYFYLRIWWRPNKSNKVCVVTFLSGLKSVIDIYHIFSLYNHVTVHSETVK